MALFSPSNYFKKPVLILYGENHKFKNFKSMPKKYPYIHAIYNYGNPNIKTLIIEVDSYIKEPFKVIKGKSLKIW
jgi:hypothetical protein